MARLLGFKAKNAAFKLTQRLIASEHLAKAHGGRLAPGPNFFTRELSDDDIRASFDAAGSATGITQAQALDQILNTVPSRTVFVPVRGESMVGVGILNDDVAAVQLGTSALPGDIVVAEIDGSHTIKEYRTPHGQPRLIAHGVDPESKSPQESFTVVGVVTGIVRNYKSRAAAIRPATRGAAK